MVGWGMLFKQYYQSFVSHVIENGSHQLLNVLCLDDSLAPIMYENFYCPQKNAAPGKATGPNSAR